MTLTPMKSPKINKDEEPKMCSNKNPFHQHLLSDPNKRVTIHSDLNKRKTIRFTNRGEKTLVTFFVCLSDNRSRERSCKGVGVAVFRF